MDCNCPIAYCSKVTTFSFGKAKVKIGMLPTENKRIALCIKDGGSSQQLVIPLIGVLALIEAAASFLRANS
jgi:hypothetical protein